ncbi:hypothetical protein [Deinococcus sp. ME38]|uniref:hypothetical protein n=1 Tax=Deinococcus sp. ME38 TaxID=3400344 RepID=UPI003B5AD091
MTAPPSRSARFSSRFRQTAAALLGLAVTGTALADRPLPTTPTYKFQGRIDYVTTGASFRTARNSATAADACQVGATATSQAVTGVPAGATIVKALLYWAASADRDGKTATNPGTVRNDTAVTFDGIAINAQTQYDDILPVVSGGTTFAYNGYFANVADITTYISGLANPNKQYTMSDLTIMSSNFGNGGQVLAAEAGLNSLHCFDSTVLGGWGMYIIYEAPTETYKNMVIYEGFDRSQNELTTRNVNGLVVPSVFEARTSVLAWEGDETLNVNASTNVAESLSFGAGQAPSAINNTFNSHLAV